MRVAAFFAQIAGQVAELGNHGVDSALSFGDRDMEQVSERIELRGDEGLVIAAIDSADDD